MKGIPEALKQERASIEWRKIAGLRDIVAHEYFGIDLEVIWDVVENKLASLRGSVVMMLDEEA